MTLVVHITSFSYKIGASTGEMGHGGGFIFDCRSVPNPGRLPEFVNLTGKDKEVQEFLTREPLANKFKELTFSLVENSIEEYLRRGFEALEVAYGCTGGQHRSVFFAEQLNHHISGKYPVQTRLRHLVIDSW